MFIFSPSYFVSWIVNNMPIERKTTSLSVTVWESSSIAQEGTPEPMKIFNRRSLNCLYLRMSVRLPIQHRKYCVFIFSLSYFVSWTVNECDIDRKITSLSITVLESSESTYGKETDSWNVSRTQEKETDNWNVSSSRTQQQVFHCVCAWVCACAYIVGFLSSVFMTKKRQQ